MKGKTRPELYTTISVFLSNHFPVLGAITKKDQNWRHVTKDQPLKADTYPAGPRNFIIRNGEFENFTAFKSINEEIDFYHQWNVYKIRSRCEIVIYKTSKEKWERKEKSCFVSRRDWEQWTYENEHNVNEPLLLSFTRHAHVYSSSY